MNDTIYISFFDGIDPIKANKFIQFVNEAVNVYKPKNIYFLIASGGGDVDSGFVLYNYLISLQPGINIVMHNVGKIDSIANVIFAAGTERYASPNSSFLYHGVSMNLNGGYNRNALVENISRLASMELRIAQTISKTSKLSDDELTSLFHQGEDKSVAFALEKEIVSEIKFPNVPAGAIYLVMNFL